MENNLPTTWAEVCQLQGLDPDKIPQFLEVEERFRKKHIANWMFDHICEAINGKDYNFQYGKQEIWFMILSWDKSVSAFRFWYTYYYLTSTDALAGARPFKSKSDCEHVAKHFMDVINDISI